MTERPCGTCSHFSRLTGHCAVYEASVVADFERRWGTVCGPGGRRWTARTIHRELQFLYCLLAMSVVVGLVFLPVILLE